MPSDPMPCPESNRPIGLKERLVLGAATVVLALSPLAHAADRSVAQRAHPSSAAAKVRSAGFAAQAASPDARFLADWIADSHDNGRAPFVILDKRQARVFVFDPDAKLVGSSPVLLGAAAGDDSAPDIGTRPMSKIRPEEKTTPAGRFVSQPGKNTHGEDIVWVDYDAAVSMHRLRMVDPKERRFERITSPDPAQRRISYGCINVPAAFFDATIWPRFGAADAVVYVLPEKRDVRQVFRQAYSAAARPGRPAPPSSRS